MAEAMGITRTDTAPGRPLINPWVVAVTVTLATFMEVLDSSIANVALPHMAGTLGASSEESTWVITSYLVSSAIVLPMSGWLSNVIGRKRFYMACVAIFTISSFLCALAPTLPMLILFRILQGAGGGGLQPSEQAILADTFSAKQRGMAFAMYGMAVVVAPAIGPTLGGWITDNYSWHWIFLINVPIGIVSLLLTQRVVHDPAYLKNMVRSNIRVDYIGISLIVVGVGFLQYVLDKGEENDWFSSNFIRFFCVMFVVGIVGLIYWELRKKDPLINLRLFKYKNFAICCFLMMLVGGVLNASTVLQPQFLQQLLGYTATNAGLALTAGGFSLVVVMPFAGMLTGKFPARNIAAVGFSFFAFSFWLTTRDLSLDMSFGNASWLRVVQLAPIPFCFIPITTAAYIGIPRQQSNQVAGLINFVRNIGGSIFIALTGAAVTNRDLWHQARLQESMNSLNIPYQQYLHGLNANLGQGFGKANSGGMATGAIYDQLNQQSGMLGYQDVYKMLFWMSIGMIFLAFMLNKNRPGEGAGGGAAMH